MEGWPELSAVERIVAASIGGCVERFFGNHRDDRELAEIAHQLHKVERERRALILAMAAQRYVDEPDRERVARFLKTIGADLELARKFRQARIQHKAEHFDLASLADAANQTRRGQD